jgi:hypothetical protein
MDESIPLMTVEDFLNELAQERSLPEYAGGASSAYTSANSNQLENFEEFQQTDDFALSPTSWPQVTDVVDSEREKSSAQKFVANPISLVRLDELSSYIAKFTTSLRMTDVASEQVKLAAEEHIKELQNKYSAKKGMLQLILFFTLRRRKEDRTSNCEEDKETGRRA